MKPGEERADAQCAGSRVRCLASGGKVFFYRYRTRVWLQKWAEHLEALTTSNVVPLLATRAA